MARARQKEGPCAPLFYSVTVVLMFFANTATAQTVELSSLELCASLDTRELKLACFEAIIKVANPVDAESPAEAPMSEIAVDRMPENGSNNSAPAIVPKLQVKQSDSDFGREQLAVADQLEAEKKNITATVVSVTRSYNRSLNFHLDNGQVWRQIEPRHFLYPKGRDFEVNISRGVMGGYRLRTSENSRMVRIRRIK
jgi:hypothetical protein